MRTELRWLILLSTVAILTMLTVATYCGALPVLRREWSLSASQAGAIVAGQQIGSHPDQHHPPRQGERCS